GHAADHDTVAEDDLRVAGEEEIRDRVELELRQLAASLLARQAADQHLRERARGLLAQPVREAAREAVAPGEIANDQLLRLLILKHFLEEILRVEDVVGDEADELLEAPVLLAGHLAVEDVVEEELRHHRRDHDVDLAPREMHEDALQPPDLARDVELHSRGSIDRKS